MVLNTPVKQALSRKQVGVTPVSNTGIKPHTGDPHQFKNSTRLMILADMTIASVLSSLNLRRLTEAQFFVSRTQSARAEKASRYSPPSVVGRNEQ